MRLFLFKLIKTCLRNGENYVSAHWLESQEFVNKLSHIYQNSTSDYVHLNDFNLSLLRIPLV